MPVSGGKFINQLALLCEVYSAKKISNNNLFKGTEYYSPNIVFGSSGGNVAAYIGLASDWSDFGIERSCQKLRSDIFISSWVPKEFNFIPSWMLSPLNGALYRKGKGANLLFEELFTSDTVKNCEIWTGTYNVTNKKAQFFCNLNKHDSMLNSFYEENLFDILPHKYLDGNLKDISIVSAASATIPVFVETQVYDDFQYADGGVMYTSPLTVFSGEITRILLGHNSENYITENLVYDGDTIMESSICDDNIISYEIDLDNSTKNPKKLVIENNGKKLRLIYFCPYQTNEIYTHKNNNIFTESCHQILHSCILQEKYCAINILKNICGNRCSEIKHTSLSNMNTEKLSQLFNKIDTYTHYVLILSPKGKPCIALDKIEPDKLLSKIRESRNNYYAEVWYLK